MDRSVVAQCEHRPSLTGTKRRRNCRGQEVEIEALLEGDPEQSISPRFANTRHQGQEHKKISFLENFDDAPSEELANEDELQSGFKNYKSSQLSEIIKYKRFTKGFACTTFSKKSTSSFGVDDSKTNFSS